MTSQAPATLIAGDILLGNAIAYYTPTPFTDWSTARSSTAWRKLGYMKDGLKIDHTREPQEFIDGYPASPIAKYISYEELSVSGSMMEFEPRRIAQLLGGLEISETVFASSPSPTTVASGSTKTSIIVADSTGYAVDDEIRVGNSGSYQYGRIKAIDTGTDTITLYEGLSGDTTPTVGHAVAKIEEEYFTIGTLALPAYIGIKVVKTMSNGKGSGELIIPRAQAVGTLSLDFQSNVKTFDGVGLPFTVTAATDASITGGGLARYYHTWI